MDEERMGEERMLVDGSRVEPMGSREYLREINIRPLDYGFIVNIGCQTVAIESKQDLIEKLTQYLNFPEETEQKYNNKKLLKHQ